MINCGNVLGYFSHSTLNFISALIIIMNLPKSWSTRKLEVLPEIEDRNLEILM
jgi:hypothetical protein